MKPIAWLAILALPLLAACNRGQGLEDVPTQISINELATQTIQTQNAPPEGWRDVIELPEIDAHLRELPGWRYEVLMSFDGIFARTSRRAVASTRAEVWFDQLGSARRVLATASGDLGGKLEENAYEAVRLGPDAFLVRENVCFRSTDEAEVTADLTASSLIGGVQRAVPASQRGIINNEEVWRYDFTSESLILPNVELTSEGRILSMNGELWVSPQHNAVIRFWVLMDVENAVVFGSPLPVTGQVIMRYDLHEVGVVPNITVPFGC